MVSMAGLVLGTQGTNATVAMLLAQLPRNIPVLAPETAIYIPTNEYMEVSIV